MVSLPIDDFLQARARDVADLLHRVGELGRAIVMEPTLHLGKHALALRMQAERYDARKSEFFAVAAVELGHFGELGLRKRAETEARLLGGGVRREHFAAGELRMRAREPQLLVFRCNGVEHRAVQLLHGTERAFVPGALRDPRRMLEHTAEPRDELGFCERVHLVERHAP